MSEAALDTDDKANDLPPVDELAILKQRCKLLGIEHSNNIGKEALLKKLKDFQEAKAPTETLDGASQPNPLTGEVTRKMTLREQQLSEQMKLIRVRITNMDPKKNDIPGEFITVANEYIGTVRKFIPFGEATEQGYHIPFCIYTFLQGRKYQHIRTIKDKKTGVNRVESQWVKEFALEVLPPLTEAELKELAIAQQAAGTVGRDHV